MKNNLKSLIDKVMEKQEAINNLTSDNRKIIGDEIALLKFLSTINSDYLYSSEVASFVADALQMLESDDQVQQFELTDILSIYKKIWLNNKSNISYFKDYIFFKINVLDQTSGVDEEVMDFIKDMDRERDELCEILSSLT